MISMLIVSMSSLLYSAAVRRRCGISERIYTISPPLAAVLSSRNMLKSLTLNWASGKLLSNFVSLMAKLSRQFFDKISWRLANLWRRLFTLTCANMKFEGCFLLKSNTGWNNRLKISSSVKSSVSGSTPSWDFTAGAGAEVFWVPAESVAPMSGLLQVCGGWVGVPCVSLAVVNSPWSPSDSTPPSLVSDVRQALEKCPTLPQE